MENQSQQGAATKRLLFGKHVSYSTVILLVILIVAALIRFRRLTKQSLEYDELQTMLDSDPGLSWAEFFKVMKDGEITTPPFYYVADRYFMYFFGYNDWAARALSAIGGIAGVAAMYFLGKEIKNKQLGLVAAALTCVNYFNIFYSQEARAYSFLWAFTALSYLFFIKVCKYIRAADAVIYAIITACLVYTHYFGFLVIVSQLVITIFFWGQEKEKKWKLIKILFFADLSIAVAYIPWLPYLQMVGNLHGDSWIPHLKPDFFISFFTEYFGLSSFVSWVAFVFIVIYVVAVFVNVKGFKNLKKNPLNLSFVFVFISVIISMGIPYLRSVLVVPMFVSRYSMPVLPSLIIAMSYGIEVIPYKSVRLFCVGGFMLLSAYFLIFVNKYYRLPIKAQFRELIGYVSSYNYPVINARTPMTYYFKKDNFKGDAIVGNTWNLVDKVLYRNNTYHNIDTFWFINFFDWPYIPAQKQKDLDTAYSIIKDSVFYWGVAQLYVSRPAVNIKTLDFTDFDTTNGKTYKDDSDVAAAIWTKDITSKPISLSKGRYTIIVESKGYPAGGVYPHNNLFVNGVKIGDFYSNIGDYYGACYGHHAFPYELEIDTTVTIKIDMDNDAFINNQDRNTFIKHVDILSERR